MPEQGRVHRSVGFPADAQGSILASLQCQPRDAEGMRELWCGVASKVADTGRLAVRCLGELFCSDVGFDDRCAPILPVLTEQAVKGTGLVEDGEVLVAIFWSWAVGEFRIASFAAPGTHPVCHAVGGEWIIVPADIAPICGSAHKSTFLVPAKAAVASVADSDPAFVCAKVTLRPLVSGGVSREVERAPGSDVGCVH